MDVPDALQWGSYRPGHTPHWIQALHSTHQGETPPVPATLLRTGDDGTIVVDVDGAERLLWNHEPGRLAKLAACNDGAVLLQWGWRLLKTRGPGGLFVFSVCDPDDHVPCPDGPITGDLFERLEKAGGVDLSIEEALRLLR